MENARLVFFFHLSSRMLELCHAESTQVHIQFTFFCCSHRALECDAPAL